MLSEVLKIMDQERLIAVTEIAEKLGWTLQRVDNTIAQLENMGYIQKREVMSYSCGKGGCSGCSSRKGNDGQSCQSISKNLYSWLITERGRSALH